MAYEGAELPLVRGSPYITAKVSYTSTYENENTDTFIKYVRLIRSYREIYRIADTDPA
jgi:hypothetical protein